MSSSISHYFSNGVFRMVIYMTNWQSHSVNGKRSLLNLNHWRCEPSSPYTKRVVAVNRYLPDSAISCKVHWSSRLIFWSPSDMYNFWMGRKFGFILTWSYLKPTLESFKDRVLTIKGWDSFIYNYVKSRGTTNCSNLWNSWMSSEL